MISDANIFFSSYTDKKIFLPQDFFSLKQVFCIARKEILS